MWKGESGQGSFFGSQLYERVVPRDHYLVRLQELIDWEKVAKPFEEAYKGGGEYGRPPWKPSILVRMLFLSDEDTLSDVQTEQFVTSVLPAKEFVGLEIDERAPDHSTLSVFRTRVLEKLKDAPFEQAFLEVLRQAKEHGIQFGKVQIVDSVHALADVDVKKDDQRQKKEQKPPRDPDATWGCKGEKRVKLPDGTTEKKPAYFYGYKTHVSLNQKTRLVTSLFSSTGKEPDTRYFRLLLDADQRKGLKPKVVVGDKGYDDGENHMDSARPQAGHHFSDSGEEDKVRGQREREEVLGGDCQSSLVQEGVESAVQD